MSAAVTLRRALLLIGVAGAAIAANVGPSSARTPVRNVIIFVADGLRSRIVTPATMPNLAALRDEGSYFSNSHSVFPTFTTANASAIATGHQLGDTGDFANSIYVGQPVSAAKGSATPFLEDDGVLGEVDHLFYGDYLNEPTLLSAARKAGYGTAAIGKLGPTLIQDHEARDGDPTIIIDDATGSPTGVPLASVVQQALTQAHLPIATPSRGDNGKSGSATEPGTRTANIQQQDFYADAATRVVLPLLKAKSHPFVLLFWSRDPDGTQHNEGDSLKQLTPGINGPSTMAALRNADDDLGRLRAALDRLGLTSTTDIFVTSDHGFSVIAKEGSTSTSAKASYPDVPPGFLPPGFLAIDIASALGLPMFEPETGHARITSGTHPAHGNALIGADPEHPSVIVAANGGSDLLYLPDLDLALARRLVDLLSRQDYVSGIFVDDRLGTIAGTLPMSAINLAGTARTPRPSMVVNFRSFVTGCAVPTNCEAEIADTSLQQGQGMHGSFGRGDTLNFMAATGPDFRRRYVDPAPTGNADIVPTLASILHLSLASNGSLVGRPITEAMPGKSQPRATHRTIISSPSPNGRRTILRTQTIGSVVYLDAAGYAGRTLGLVSPAKRKRKP